MSPPAGLDAQPAGHRGDQGLALLCVLHREVEVGHGDQLLDVGPADQRAAEQVDLLADVGLDGEADISGRNTDWVSTWMRADDS